MSSERGLRATKYTPFCFFLINVKIKSEKDYIPPNKPETVHTLILFKLVRFWSHSFEHFKILFLEQSCQ